MPDEALLAHIRREILKCPSDFHSLDMCARRIVEMVRPATPRRGDVYVNTDEGLGYEYDGRKWRTIGRVSS